MIVEQLLSILKGMILPVIGILIPITIATWAWTRRDLLSWVHVAFYIVGKNADGKKTIQIRTVKNVSVFHLMMNNVFVTFLVYLAARRATSKYPILKFSGDTAWRINNLCRGYVSGLFPEGVLNRATGIENQGEWFVITLIRDQTQKGDNRIGLVIIRKNDIANHLSFAGNPSEWQLEAPHHQAKLNLLQFLQAIYLAEETPGSTTAHFLDLELYRS
ncbi:MAG TPA: hypothetical protein VJI96_00515 [Candidatus Andersenbacteria bacterium]|nr:hypothetical protein [Candidatus Andersenbacteria bacterium]